MQFDDVIESFEEGPSAWRDDVIEDSVKILKIRRDKKWSAGVNMNVNLVNFKKPERRS